MLIRFKGKNSDEIKSHRLSAFFIFVSRGNLAVLSRISAGIVNFFMKYAQI
jgi:hypothetical protein